VNWDISYETIRIINGILVFLKVFRSEIAQLFFLNCGVAKINKSSGQKIMTLGSRAKNYYYFIHTICIAKSGKIFF